MTAEVRDWDPLVSVIVDPDVMGCMLLGDDEGAALHMRPGLEVDEAVALLDWAEDRANRFIEHGPEPDGWQRRTDGVWQLWARRVELPFPT